MFDKIKELFETNPKSMWTISFLLLVIFIFTPVLKSEYEAMKYREEVKEFRWKEVEREREKEEYERINSMWTEEYILSFVKAEEGVDVDKDDNYYTTLWLWFYNKETNQNIAFEYTGNKAVDSQGRPLEQRQTYVIRLNHLNEVKQINRQ